MRFSVRSRFSTMGPHVEVGKRRPHLRHLLLRGRRPGDRPLQLLLCAGGLGLQHLRTFTRPTRFVRDAAGSWKHGCMLADARRELLSASTLTQLAVRVCAEGHVAV